MVDRRGAERLAPLRRGARQGAGRAGSATSARRRADPHGLYGPVHPLGAPGSAAAHEPAGQTRQRIAFPPLARGGPARRSKGWVRRERDPEDGRVQIAVLTDDGLGQGGADRARARRGGPATGLRPVERRPRCASSPNCATRCRGARSEYSPDRSPSAETRG